MCQMFSRHSAMYCVIYVMDSFHSACALADFVSYIQNLNKNQIRQGLIAKITYYHRHHYCYCLFAHMCLWYTHMWCGCVTHKPILLCSIPHAKSRSPHTSQSPCTNWRAVWNCRAISFCVQSFSVFPLIQTQTHTHRHKTHTLASNSYCLVCAEKEQSISHRCACRMFGDANNGTW